MDQKTACEIHLIKHCSIFEGVKCALEKCENIWILKYNIYTNEQIHTEFALEAY